MKSEKYNQACEGLWEHAKYICNINYHWRPDTNLVLMHSAIGPYLAANELWRIHFQGEIPNTVFSNIGREKVPFYDSRPRPGFNDRFVPDYEEVESVGHFRAWMSYQKEWIEALKNQFERVIGFKLPGRILVIDDFHFEGVTSSFAFALLELVYPSAKIRFSTSLTSGSWKYMYAPWVQEHFPEYLEMEDKRAQSILTSALYNLISGTEDIDPDRQDYKTIDAQSEIIAPLLKYGPAEKWLSLVEWSREEIARIIQRKAHEYDPGDFDTSNLFGKQKNWHLQTQILRDIWLQGSVSVRECMHKYGESYYRVSKELKELINFKVVLPYGKGKNTRYTLEIRDILEIQQANISEFIEYLDFTKRGK